jgi:hypothetical protein
MTDSIKNPNEIQCLAMPDAVPGDTLTPFYNRTGSIVKRPPEGWSLAPWVKIEIVSSGRQITVGNESCKEVNNNVVIREFEFAQTDGFTCRFSLQDQEGSSFVSFMQDLVKDFKLLHPAGAIRMYVQWGWVASGCREPIPSQVSPTHVMMPDQIEANFAQGKFTFDITAKDIPFRMMEGRTQTTQGDDKNKMPLKLALIKLFTSGEYPTLSDVRFLRVQDKCVVPCGFASGDEGHIYLGTDQNGLPMYDDTKQGESETYIPEGRDKLATARAWIKDRVSKNNKGWIMSYDSTTNRMIFWEDPKPSCSTEWWDYDAMSIGTYIVNGGKWSPVIEFNPKLRWDFGSLQNVAGAVPTTGIKSNPATTDDDSSTNVLGQGELDCDTKVTADRTNLGGMPVSPLVATRVQNVEGKESPAFVQRAETKDGKANRLLHREIQADLVLMGDPNMITPSLGIWARNVTIVFINPYYILPSGKCGEWLSEPSCNPVFSSKAWWINRVTHKITPGHYTTTLGVYLAASGVDIDTCDSLGGKGSGVCGSWNPCTGKTEGA